MTDIGICPSELDKVGDFETNSSTVEDGETTTSWGTTYSNVRSKKLPPLFRSTSERFEGRQPVYKEQATFVIRKENKVITPANMRYLVSSEYYYVTNVREYKGSRKWLAIDVEKRDNQ